MTSHCPHQGDRIVYKPRVPYGRQHELAGIVTRVIDAAAGVVDLMTFPTNSEVQHVNQVGKQSETVTIHCWSFVEDPRLVDLEMRIVKLERLIGRGKKADQGELVG